MDLSQLPKLGKVAGVPGIALGAAVLVLGAVIEKSDALPQAWRGPVWGLIALGGVVLAVFAVIAWWRGKGFERQVARTEGDDSSASAMDLSKGKNATGQHASTKGKNSPATTVRM